MEILSGNEAIARGAWEAGVKLAAAYPGTPSTEILEALAEYEGVYCEWSPNEKVAMEVGIGASMAGGRALVCMKHVGLNVAADPFFSSSYVGLEAGMVVVSADDPGMHSSQDEQDNRNYAKFARVPLLGALRQRRGQGVHDRRLRALRALRHSGAVPHHHPDLALQEPGQVRRADRDPSRSPS